ncbi:DsbA family protein [Croceibacterium ferulae]|uniref:DsbA family protein n=1 Tax=Croceibacterium ferulae TaxID=1854641 RepID=UPI000EAD028E|nr:DsbA family protein [Croceibacterium ferulae]
MRWLLTILVALVAGFAGAAGWSYSGLGDSRTRDYLLANPQVLPEAIALLQQQEQQGRIGPLRAQLEQPFSGAVLGNPQGAVTLVAFSDYACGFCRRSLDDVKALIAANPDLKVVMREYPILSPASADAARMALAAAQQGRYAAFHDAMFRLGPPSEAGIAAAAREAGLDMARAQAAIRNGAIDQALQANGAMAAQLGINGTPAWIAGDQLLSGAVGQQALAEAVQTARDGNPGQGAAS